jgi:hypothetical protein
MELKAGATMNHTARRVVILWIKWLK